MVGHPPVTDPMPGAVPGGSTPPDVGDPGEPGEPGDPGEPGVPVDPDGA